MKALISLCLLSLLLTSLSAQSPGNHDKPGYLVMDMVHHNPGEAMTQTEFCNPEKLASFGMNGMVINEFKFPQCAVSFSKFDKRVFPKGSKERAWVESLTKEIRKQIDECHRNGLHAFYFMDIIVLPRKLVELYKDEICDEKGKISFEKEKTWEIHRIMLNELFDRFPDMDGLVIRTGETYTHNIPYHIGNGPVNYNKYDTSIGIHARLMNLLREEVCVKRNKKIVYRTWCHGYFHTNPKYYLAVTDRVEPHPSLYMAVKHTQGDYLRTFGFNKTIAVGKHKQVIEVQCQREYEGKGAFPNYVANAVINGFEENKNAASPRCLNDVKDSTQFYGVWTWSRGGGWFGPYLSNELWCDLNTYVMAQWAKNPTRTEEEVFNEYALQRGVSEETLPYFRRLCLLTPDAIIRGRGSLIHPVNVTWTRDHFLGGIGELKWVFDKILKKNMVEESLYEMKLAVGLWREIVNLSRKVECSDKRMEQYIRTSSLYGYWLHTIMEQGWIVMLKGYQGDQTGVYDKASIKLALEAYDKAWKGYRRLKEENGDCATLYYDQYVRFHIDGVKNRIDLIDGMGGTVDKYRNL
ncbi:hypothetical protein [uncultured Bacteroides sp.]|jgi:hypothetical protein|uniref:hypothetical protein n=1 Tax=uncultured Bacteroides sp. TaxID=162156 RepID=UPI002585E882|nr:hypothetical protein [uncultured Bacteroides sp.]